MRPTLCCHLLSTYYTRVFCTFHACCFLKFLGHAKGMAAFSAKAWSPGWESSSGFSCVFSPYGKTLLWFFHLTVFPGNFCERMLILERSRQLVYTAWRKEGENPFQCKHQSISACLYKGQGLPPLCFQLGFGSVQPQGNVEDQVHRAAPRGKSWGLEASSPRGECWEQPACWTKGRRLGGRSQQSGKHLLYVAKC